MSKYVINDTTLSAIGNAIKTKKGDSTPILVSDFATEIANLPSGGGSSSQVVTRIPSSTGDTNTGLARIIAADLGSSAESEFQKIQSFFLSGSKQGSYSDRPFVTYTKPETETGYITATVGNATWHIYPVKIYYVTPSTISSTDSDLAIGYPATKPNYMVTYYKSSAGVTGDWDNGSQVGMTMGSVAGGTYILEGE